MPETCIRLVVIGDVVGYWLCLGFILAREIKANY